MSTFHDSQNQNLKFVVCMYKISFVFDLGRSFDSISLTLGRTAISVENCSCIGFESIRPMGRGEGELGVVQIREFLDSSEIHRSITWYNK